MVEGRRSYNAIRELRKSSGEWITQQEELKAEAVNYLKDFLQYSPDDFTGTSIDKMQTLIHFRCSEELQNMMIKEVTGDEIRYVLFSMPMNKALGPNGFTVEFFKAAWSVIGSDFITVIQSFFINGFLLRGVNSTILALIPKKTGISEIKDYRPIACCNIIDKVISKLMANRLKNMLPQMIEPNQSAFIRDRLLLENVLLASELVQSYHLETGTSRSALKIDISKAFDSIQWSFIIKALRTMCFPERFIFWVEQCITTASFSVQVNGELAGYFPSSRGIRQGCSLSPYLFVITMNVLTLLLNKAATLGEVGYHPKCRELGLTNLSFADDILVFTDGNRDSIEGVINVFDKFAKMSGLKMNMEKSTLFLAGATEETRRRTWDQFQFTQGTLPVKYLGLPLLTRRLSQQDYGSLLEKIRLRIRNWSSNFLSFAGRLQLISSVISGIINFWIAAFRLPRKCIRDIEAMCSGFLWSGLEMNARKAKLSWEDICYPKSEGGLGFRRLDEANRVNGLKLIWKILMPNNSLWVQWIKRYLIRKETFWTTTSINGSWIWRKILKLRDIALPFTKWIITTSSSVSFWFDNWLNGGRLYDIRGRRGAIELGIPLRATVKQATETRRRNRRQRSEQINIIEAELDRVRSSIYPDGEDLLLWRKGPDKFHSNFSTKSTWEQIRNKKPRVTWSKGIWFKQAIPKCAFLSWVAIHNRLSTFDRILRWNPSTNPTCKLCSSSPESREHLFFECSYAKQVWTRLALGLLGSKFSASWSTLILLLANSELHLEQQLLYRLAFQTTIYHIWRERNQRHHNNIKSSQRSLIIDIDKMIRTRLTGLQTRDNGETSTILTTWINACSQHL